MRDATDADTLALMAIYNHSVEHSTATLDLELRTVETQRAWMKQRRGATPLIVAELDEMVIGFASLSPFKDRAAYRTTVENSIYVHHEFRGQGIGFQLLTEIINRARQNGFHSVIARVPGDNPASIQLHRRLGYEVVGVEREVGRKFSRWLDVTELQLLLDR